MHATTTVQYAVLAFTVVACNSPPQPAAESPDGASQAACPDDQHRCSGGACIADQPNEPAIGCANGCGTACANDSHLAVCTNDGWCSTHCPLANLFDRYQDSCSANICRDREIACGPVIIDGNAYDCGSCAPSVTCGANECAFPSDQYEANNTREAAFNLGVFGDDPSKSFWIDRLNIDSADDEDWFRFQIDDVLFVGVGSPAFTAQLAHSNAGAVHQIQLPASYEITYWIRCVQGAPYEATASNYGTLQVGVDTSIDCDGTDDDANVILRIRKLEREPPRGDSYDLHIIVYGV